MSLSWITPKTDWTNTTKFTYEDYNRIRNNLLYVNERLNAMYPDKAVELDLGQPKTGYMDKYYPSEFNAFEKALESFTRVGLNVNIGDAKNFKGNDPFIMWDELNRLEKCCLRWKEAQPLIKTYSIQPNAFVLNVGETIQLSLAIDPKNAIYTVDWSSSSNSIATVSNGLVTAVSDGHVTITAIIHQSGLSDLTCSIQGAVLVKATSISISPNKATLTHGEPLNFTINVTPPNATNKNNFKVESSSSDIITILSDNKTAKATATAGKTSVVVKVDDVSAKIDVHTMMLPPDMYFTADAVVYENAIHLIGSSVLDSSLTNIKAHKKWSGDRWEDVSYIPTRMTLTYGCACVYRGKLHIFGGINDGSAHYMWTGFEWQQLASIPMNLTTTHKALVYNDNIYVFGEDSTYKDYYFKWDGTSWDSLGKMPSYTSVSNLLVFNNLIYSFGGINYTYQPFKPILMTYNGSTWTEKGDYPDHGIRVVHNGKIHSLGAGTDGKGHTVYDGTNWSNGTKLKYPMNRNTSSTKGEGKAISYNGQLYAFDGAGSVDVNSIEFHERNAYNMFTVDE